MVPRWGDFERERRIVRKGYGVRLAHKGALRVTLNPAAVAGARGRDTVSAWPIKGHQRRLRGNGLQGKTVRVYGLNLSLIFEAIVLTLGLI